MAQELSTISASASGMRSLANVARALVRAVSRLVSTPAALLCLFTLPLAAAPRFTYHVLGDEPGSWPEIFSSIGMSAGPAGTAGVIVAPRGVTASAAQWSERVERGALLVIEGDSSLAADFGFRPSAKPRVPVLSVEDLRTPELRIVWEKAVDVPVFEIPQNAHVFARERSKHAPLLAGYRKGTGAVLWIAVPPGPHGYERFPYILQALTESGLAPARRTIVPFGTVPTMAMETVIGPE